MEKRICVGCSSEFELTYDTKKYCTQSCFYKNRKYDKSIGFQTGKLNPSSNPVRREQIRLEKLGKKPSEAHKKKISQSMKKTLKDPTIREKWRLAQLGRKHSETSKANMRDAKDRLYKDLRKTVKYLKPKLDVVFSQYIRKRDSVEDGELRYGPCITCKKIVPASGRRTGQAGHFISRRHNSTRFDEKNVHLQCAGCNMFGSGEQYKYSLELDKLYGDGTSKQLHDKALQVKKFTAVELQLLIDEYKQKIKELP